MEDMTPAQRARQNDRSKATGKYQRRERGESPDLIVPGMTQVGPHGHATGRPCFDHAKIRQREREMTPVFGRKQSWFQRTFKPRPLPEVGSTCRHTLLAFNESGEAECVDCGWAVHLIATPKKVKPEKKGK